MKLNSLQAGDNSVSFCAIGRRKNAKTQGGFHLKKKSANFDARQALRKVAMAESKQALRGVIASLRNKARAAGLCEDGRSVAAKIKKVLKKASEKMDKLEKEAVIAKEKARAKKKLERKLEEKLRQTLQNRKTNRKMREWDDVRNADVVTAVSRNEMLLSQKIEAAVAIQSSGAALDAAVDTAVGMTAQICADSAASGGSVDITV